jgi:hypothetical protein
VRWKLTNERLLAMWSVGILDPLFISKLKYLDVRKSHSKIILKFADGAARRTA